MNEWMMFLTRFDFLIKVFYQFYLVQEKDASSDEDDYDYPDYYPDYYQYSDGLSMETETTTKSN